MENSLQINYDKKLILQINNKKSNFTYHYNFFIKKIIKPSSIQHVQ